MKRVLIVAPDFLPSTAPPALRVKFFVEHLPEFGWEPIVVTAEASAYDWPVCEESWELLRSNVEVRRVPALPVRMARRFGIGDVGIRALPWLLAETGRILAERGADVVLLPVPPYVPMVLGRLLKRIHDVPYVIDYIDPWTTDFYWSVPRKDRPPKWVLANAISRVLEPFALADAADVVGVSLGTIEDVAKRHPGVRADKCGDIPYGAEPRDFEAVAPESRAEDPFHPDDGLRHVCSIGRGGVDLLPALESLLRALADSRRKGDELLASVRLHFIGTSYAATPGVARPIETLAKACGLEGVVREYPHRISYPSAIRLMRLASALLVLGSVESHYTASKVFPYILSGTPVLGILKDTSSAAKYLEETRAGEVVRFSTAEQLVSGRLPIASALRAVLRSPRRPVGNGNEVLGPYSARAMTERLVRVLDRAASSR